MNIRRILWTTTLSASCLASFAQPALAYEAEGAKRSSAGVDVGFYSESESSGTVTMISPVVHGMVGVGENFAVGLDWGFSYVSLSGNNDSEGRFRMGNPFIAGYYLMNVDNFHFKMGAGVALPLAKIPRDGTLVDAVLAGSAYTAAAGTRGFKDLWLWAPESLGLVAPISVEVVGGPLVLGADAAFAALIYTGDNSSDETDVIIQISPKAGFRAGPVTLGARLTEVLRVTSEVDDKSQLSLEPFVEADFGAAYARAAFTMPLDEPLGFAFDDNKAWGVHVGAGARF